MKLQHTDSRVFWEGGGLDCAIRPLDAIRLGDRILVIHAYMAYPRELPAPNLVAYSLTGSHLWTAANPTQQEATDAYVNFMSESPLRVWNFACIVCTIDPESGKLLHKEFSK